MKISVINAPVQSDQDVSRIKRRVGEVASISGLDSERRRALIVELDRITSGLLSTGGGEIEVLVDDGPAHDFLLCSGDQITVVHGRTSEQPAPADLSHMIVMATPLIANLAGGSQLGVRGRLDLNGYLSAPSAPSRDFVAEIRAKMAAPVTDERSERITLLEAITALRSKEEQLRKLSQAVEQSPAMIMVTDTSGRIEYVNPRFTQVTGFSSDDAIGQTPSILKSGETQRPVYAQMWQTILAGREWRGEILNKKKDGSKYWELASISPIRDENGVVTHFIAIKEDITDRKRVEQELVWAREEAMKASQAKSEFLANMSHEIRTPLNAIIGMADLLWETPLAAEQREYVRIFRRAGSTLLNLINDILDLSKVEAGHLALESVDFDLRSMMEKTVEVMALPAHEKDVELVCHIRPEVPATLKGDPTRLRQVITNLIGNAIKFTEHGEVVVEVGLDHAGEAAADGKGRLHFAIRDTGIGIPRDKLGAIFDRFAQAGLDTTRQYGGTGLGLTISKRLVEMMGGAIWAESEVGYGSTFHFTAEFGVHHDAAKTTPMDESAFKGLRVLVVDDNSTNRFILREMLATSGARVSTVSGGRLALLELRRAREQSDPYRIVLLDCRMPDMDGLELAKRVTEEHGESETSLIMLTSDRQSDDLSQIQELGIAHYLAKPIKRSDLLDCMALAMGKPLDTPLPATESADQVAAEDTRPLRVLLVEDSEDSRLLIQSYLKKTPYVLEFAENGEQGVETFKSGRYDIVLMDTQMPRMDGTTATRTIRAWETEQGIKATPIVALTAYALREDAQRSLQAGCDAHLAKPVKKSKLLETIFEVTGGGAQAVIDDGQVQETGGKILVRVDDDVRDLVPRYLENRRKELDLLRETLASGDFETIRNVGHTLKGTGGGYGFQVISEVGKQIEKAAAELDAGEIRRAIDRLADYLSRVEVVAA